MNEFLTWEFIGTSAGATLAVTLLTQVFKKYISTIDPKWISLAAALVIVLSGNAIIGDMNFETAILSVFNALLVTGTSCGLYEACKSTGKCLKGKRGPTP